MKPYIALMKLRVVELLLVTTVPALFLAADGLPPWDIAIATLVGGTLAAGAANAFNMVIESDIDEVMGRTSKRPIVNQQVSEEKALAFAFAISILSLVIFWIWTNPLATALTVSAIAFYVFAYTLLLKRRTPQNIVWGGIAGCIPVLIGWAAVTNTLAAPAWWFFLLIFFWTPPHFWALAIKYKEDYARAGVPMLPVVAPMRTVVAQMWMHTIFMVLTSYALLISLDAPIWAYITFSAVNGFFIFQLTRMRGESKKVEKAAIGVFHDSITYLSLISLVLLVLSLL
ncbi:MAG: heme o synthase [Candidatus Nanopelagicaceae bacterium]